MKRSLPLILFLVVFLSGACTSVRRPAEALPPKPVHVVVVGTTDVHGWYNGHIEAPKGREGVLWGGLPVLSSYVDAIRDDVDGRVLVVDSGDMFQGTLESNMFEGEPVVRAYNAVGYTAAVIVCTFIAMFILAAIGGVILGLAAVGPRMY